MGLLNLLLGGGSTLGWNGNRPPYPPPSPTSTLHNESSINDRPDITKTPSGLDEDDPNNNSRYRSTNGNRYIDNLPG
jgi:hypothetical protein